MNTLDQQAYPSEWFNVRDVEAIKKYEKEFKPNDQVNLDT
jgi:hypothetical protein